MRQVVQHLHHDDEGVTIVPGTPSSAVPGTAAQDLEPAGVPRPAHHRGVLLGRQRTAYLKAGVAGLGVVLWPVVTDPVLSQQGR